MKSQFVTSRKESRLRSHFVTSKLEGYITDKNQGLMAVADLLYNSLLAQIGKPLESGRKTVVARVNETIVETYRQIGKHIIEFELAGN